jgi:hypothetical protein
VDVDLRSMKGLGADSEEKHEPASGVDTELVDSLKALDPERPIREEKRTCALVARISSAGSRNDLGSSQYLVWCYASASSDAR